MKKTKPSGPRLRIVLVDDHSLVRRGLSTIIASDPTLEVVGETTTADALATIQREKPAIAIVDLSLKGAAAIETIKAIAYNPATKIVAIDLQGESAYATRAIKAGAKGYLTSDIEANLLTALHRVNMGSLYVSNDVAQLMVQSLAKAAANPVADPVEALSDRELEMAEMMGRGLSASQIAEAMEISIKTVETHKAHIKAKLGIATGAQLVRYCVEWYSNRHHARGLTPSVR